MILCDTQIKALVPTIPPDLNTFHGVVIIHNSPFVVIIGLQNNLGQLHLGGVIPSNSMVTPKSYHPHAALPKEAGYLRSDTIDTQPIHSL